MGTYPTHDLLTFNSAADTIGTVDRAETLCKFDALDSESPAQNLGIAKLA